MVIVGLIVGIFIGVSFGAGIVCSWVEVGSVVGMTGFAPGISHCRRFAVD